VFPSDDCASGTNVVDGFAADGYVRVRYIRPATDTTWVCVRIDTTALQFGGKFVVSGPAAGTGPLPSTDSNVESCATTPGNTAPGQHPLFSGGLGDPEDPPYLPFLVDSYQNGGAVWVCVGVASVRTRIVIPVGITITQPNIAFLPDAGGRDVDVAGPPAMPSGTCQASGLATRYADVVSDAGRVFLYTWQPSANVVKVCVRASGAAAAGGVLTIDGSNATGTLPSVTIGDDMAPCTTQIVHLDNPAVDVRRSPGTGVPASLCLAAGGRTVRVTVTLGNGQPPAAIQWSPDPGTP
jgi:hypothetical protein